MKLVDQILENSPDPYSVRKSTANVFKNLKLITVKKNNLEKFAHLINKKLKGLLSENPCSSEKLSPQRVFIQDVVNFCFWAKKGQKKWGIEYPKGNITSGGWYSLAAAFDRALSESIPIFDASYLEKISIKEANYIFRSATTTQIPLLNERVRFLNEAGKILNQKFKGNIKNMLEETSNDASEVAKTVIRNFPSFEDSTTLNNKKVYFYKRAQIFAYDLSLLPNSKIKNIEKLTVFADYKLPQIMRYFGILKYAQPLADKVDNQELIKKDSLEEIEIRCATIWVGELLAYKLKLPPPLVDNAIWLMSQKQPKDIQPYHRVLTTNY